MLQQFFSFIMTFLVEILVHIFNTFFDQWLANRRKKKHHKIQKKRRRR